MKNILDKIAELPSGKKLWYGNPVDGFQAIGLTTDELQALASHLKRMEDERDEAVKAERLRIATELGSAVQNALDVHNRMTAPRGVTGTTMHGCEMCDALNNIFSIAGQLLAARTNQ